MKTFHLPDLGEGLMEAEIVRWHVAVGDEVKADQPLVSVETAKAIVEVPSPRAGRIVALYGKPGDVIHTHDPLVEFEEGAEDTGTVVGELGKAAARVEDRPLEVGRTTVGIKATPAVRALAQRLDVDLSIVTPSGPDGLILASDVQRVARVLAEAGPLEPLRGVRRAMARNMAQAHAEVVPVTLTDEADIQAWPSGSDVTLRLLRALVAGCKAEPALNAWYDSHAIGRRVLKQVHVGIAVDTPDGLFVPVMRDVASRTPQDLRRGLDALKAAVKSRQIPPEELRGYTITLSNFGMIAGRFATPVVLPPTVAILGAGRIRTQVVVAAGAPAVHRVLPLSLTFDHRAVTGGEAGRFLAAVIADLEAAQ
ncbi:MAG TPA: dihydrolipoamide acetyltransferase family protein [Candidatus Competibacteraceae bacterium]|nr:dihydrolipoamide acetyltransferase family protein [Candidatus Competibacteraceae bacterium]